MPSKRRDYPSGIYLRGKTFWVRYWVPGKGEVRESSRSTKLKEAQVLLRERTRHAQKFGVTAIDERKFTLDDAFEFMKADYEKQALRSFDTAKYQFDRLADFFGGETPLVQIDKGKVNDYGFRRHQGAGRHWDEQQRKWIPWGLVGNCAINREIARLNRLFYSP